MKKIISILLMLCMVLSSFAFAFADETGEENSEARSYEDFEARSEEARYVKVGLYYQTNAVDSFKINSDSGFIIAKGTSKGWTQENIRTDATELTVTVEDGAACLSDADGVIVSSLKNYVVLSAAEDPDERIVTIKSKKYRDGFTATVYGGTKLNIINYIELEHYVRGVIANEMGASYPMEALKAQAIAARSYGIKGLNNHASNGFDLCTGQHCQVYRGVSSEYQSTDTAAAETKGQVLTYDGKVVQGYYYATSGGYCMNSEDVWLNPLGYCKSRVDDFAADYKWTSTFTMEQIQEKLKNAGKSVGTVTGVQITARNDNGTARTVTIYGTNGNTTYSKSSMLSFFGCKSFVFAMSDKEFVWTSSNKTVTADPIKLYSRYTPEPVTSGETITVMNAMGQMEEVSVADIRMHNGKSVYAPSYTEEGGYTDDLITGTVYIAGNGNGHGVGMPQTSARNMANEGYTCEDILKYYYKDIEIGMLE